MNSSDTIVGTAASEGGLRALLPALLLAAGVVIFSGFSFYAPPAQGEMGVVFAPWTGQAEAMMAITAAGGRLVDSTRMSNVMIAFGSDPDFAERVRAQGAWFTMAARGLCTAPS